MLSIKEIKRRLPKDFLNEINEIYSPITVDKILKGMVGDRLLTLRVNSIKYDYYRLINYFKENNIKFERVSWYEDAFIIKNVKEKDLQNLEIYNKGFVYFQSLSSMVPPLILNPIYSDRILDLTAAPGSKTTQLACLIGNKGMI